ncbi:MAG: hypothetical protein NZ480_01945, partial [Bdellovibrionaceae bacterium]|nr:hypothetical protein [Pseudobdellovibrionaceae bacterium]MDW8191068.1 hypothetical protein [Pseudobdellovibrionaceae bacterium]
APIVPCFGYEGAHCYEIHFMPPVFFEDEKVQNALSHQDAMEQNLALVHLFNSQIERMILKVPEHWMWIHRRWKRWK